MSDVSSEGTQADSYVIDCWLFQMLASYTVSNQRVRAERITSGNRRVHLFFCV